VIAARLAPSPSCWMIEYVDHYGQVTDRAWRRDALSLSLATCLLVKNLAIPACLEGRWGKMAEWIMT
jgi:hypothetical protein